MKEKSLGKYLEWIRHGATKKDKAAVEAATNFKLTNPNTGMTKEEWQEVFGDADPESVAQLHVLAGKKAPRNPRQWRKFAEEVKARSGKLFEEEKPKNSR